VLRAVPERLTQRLQISSEQRASEGFDEYFPVFKAFVTQNSRLPKPRDTHEGWTVGKWGKDMAYEYRQGLLLAAQVQALEAVPGWRWGGRKGSTYLTYEAHLDLLNDFIKQHGRLPRSEEVFAGHRIGEWCAERRSDYKHGRLPSTLAALLEQQVPEWEWDLLASSFKTNLDLLLGFVAEHGRPPTQRETFGGKNLGAWVNKRRLAYRAGKLPAEQIQALQAVPGWWWSAEELYDMDEDVLDQ
jgi:hypothetical protein